MDGSLTMAVQDMQRHFPSQRPNGGRPTPPPAIALEAILPNPKLKLLDQVREVSGKGVGGLSVEG